MLVLMPMPLEVLISCLASLIPADIHIFLPLLSLLFMSGLYKQYVLNISESNIANFV